MEIKEALELFKKDNAVQQAYSHALGVLYYDQDTVAPKNSAAGFASTMGIMSEIMYKLQVSDDHIETVMTLHDNMDQLDTITRREVEEEYRSFNFMKNIPMDEYTAYSKLLAESQGIWQEAKVTDNYALFEPYLAKLIEYTKKFAEYQNSGLSNYNFWLNEFERGISTEMLDNFFGKLKNAIVPLIREIKERGRKIDTSFIEVPYSIPTQKLFSDYLMKVMSINPDDCIIGEVEHPFTTNYNKHDVRITTHYYENSVASSMYSVIHEGGHALYELNTGDDLIGSPLAGGASMGIHESQSRFFENLIGRSEAFIEYIFPKMKELFPEQLKKVSAHDFYLAVNRAEPSLIRTEADELTYCLHIMVRYDIEKQLIDGSLTTKDIPAEWKRLYKEYLGVDVPSDREGALQDSHWSGGSFGYFPSYALGSAYGAQILYHIKKELDVDKLVSEGKISDIVAWLTDKIYKYGRVMTPAEIIENACGESFNPDYYIDYLTEKFRKIYEL